MNLATRAHRLERQARRDRPSGRGERVLTRIFDEPASRRLRWAVVVAAVVLPYAGPRLAHAAPPTPLSAAGAPRHAVPPSAGAAR